MNGSIYAPLAEVAACRILPETLPPQVESFEPDLPVGLVLDGRFVVQERICRTRLSTLYRGLDREQGACPVAIKVPLQHVACDPAGFSRFRREEATGLRLQHPGLLRFIPVGRRSRELYLVTELLEGCTLSDLLRQLRVLPERDALRVALGTAEALMHLHGLGFVHRDLKPSNLMLCPDRTLRVIDFGEVAPVERKFSVLAAVSPVVCTPEYMAPEQFEHRPNDERTDVYCLGAILYEMLTGVVPFPATDRWDAAYLRTTGDPVAPRVINPEISPAAEEIVLHALQREPAARYVSMADFAGELRAPDCVVVTGLASRLRSPRWKLSFHGTPLLAGALIGLAFLGVLTALFLVLRLFHPGH